jgi:hypothetical protein
MCENFPINKIRNKLFQLVIYSEKRQKQREISGEYLKECIIEFNNFMKIYGPILRAKD